MQSNLKWDLVGAFALLFTAMLIALIAMSARGQDREVENGYYVLNIPNVEKAKICSPKPFLWVIPRWGDCKIVNIDELILWVKENGSDLPESESQPEKTPEPFNPMQIPTPAE